MSELKKDFDVQNKSGEMFIEPRTDKGIGIFSAASKEAKSACVALSERETMMMVQWLNEYVGNNIMWNAAIEAAALKLEEMYNSVGAYNIRKLKK
jgi:hypothetical protein